MSIFPTQLTHFPYYRLGELKARSLGLKLFILFFTISEEASKVMVELLNTYTDDNASQAKEDAQNCIVSFLAKPNVLIMDHLQRLRPVAALEGTPIHKVSSSNYRRISDAVIVYILPH